MQGRWDLPYGRSAQVLAAVEVHDEHVGRLHELFLHAGGRDEEVVMLADTGAAACAGDLGAQLAMLFVILRLLAREGHGLTQPRV